jgi:hypothetical protein
MNYAPNAQESAVSFGRMLSRQYCHRSGKDQQSECESNQAAKRPGVDDPSCSVRYVVPDRASVETEKVIEGPAEPGDRGDDG